MPERDAHAGRRPPHRLVVVWILAAVYALNFLDRQILSILAEPIRVDLGLTDTQLGLLGGLTFALFYTTFGIPLGWLADRTRRVAVIAGACALWSGFTAACGLAQSFWQLALARMGVGIGEAGGSPPAYAVIADSFPPQERGRALAIYSLGMPVGSMLGVVLGGSIAAAYGWRAAFFAVGLPGVLLALLLLWLVPEPRRGRFDGDAPPAPAPPLLAGAAAFLRDRSLALTALGVSLSAFVGFASLAWIPPFLIRAKGMSMGEVAGYYSLALGLAGVAGALGSGWLVDLLTRRDPRWFGWLPALAALLAAPFWIAAVWAPRWPMSLALLGIPILLNNCTLAPALAAIQAAAPPARRSLYGAMMLFVVNLIGMGGGPLFVGTISDLAKPRFGDRSLGVGLLALIPVLLLTVVVVLAQARAIGRDPRFAPAGAPT